MTDDVLQARFESTAKRAQELAEAHPGRYRFLLFCYGVFGYVVVFAVLLALVAMVAGLVFMAIKSTALLLILLKKKLVFLIIPMIWILLTALWVKLEAPTGYVLRRKDFPQLFATLDQLRKALKTPAIHEVILTPDLNAGIVQTPRLGVFGWHRNTLLLGLELLLVMPPEQARAVIAHELGHLSGNHSRFAGWIYRVRLTWQRIMDAFAERKGLSAQMMSRFFDWYAVKFAAFSFALARQNEYEADQVSAELTDPQSAADALVNSHVRAPYVDEHYWQRLFERADTQREPEQLPWAGLSQWLADDEQGGQNLQDALATALARETSYADTHPSLQDRLRALGIEPAVPDVAAISAASVWLGERLDEVIANFDHTWHNNVAESWRARYDYVQEAKSTLEQLRDRPVESLDDETLWRRATLTEEFESAEAARELFRAYQARHPEDPQAAFVLGRMALNDNGDELLEQMKVAVQLPHLIHDACRYAYHFLAKRDRMSETEWWVEQSDRQSAVDAEVRAERATITVEDTLDKPNLSAETVEAIARQLEEGGKVKKAWLARKVVKHYPETPALAIAVVAKGNYWTEDGEREAVQQTLDIDCTYYVLPKSGKYKNLALKIIEHGEPILPRP